MYNIKTRPYILTIAGFDPTGGAGVLADVKTFEQNNCIGMAVQTANTVQTDQKFYTVNWMEKKLVDDQLKVLLKSYQFNYVKIGLVSSTESLSSFVQSCVKANPTVRIIWDPVLSASAGFMFSQNLKDLADVLKNLYLITPNFEEILNISGESDAMLGAQKLSAHCKVLLKGGHNPNDAGKDFLFENGKQNSFNPKNIKFTPKHGTGCVFASAITANLANGYPLQKSILRSKRYIEHFISSNSTLIGTHKP